MQSITEFGVCRSHAVKLYSMNRPLIVFLFLLCCVVWAPTAFSNDQSQFAGFPEPESDFVAHIAKVRDYLIKNQMHQRTESDAELNLPFERSANESVPYRGRFLLIHGLNDSPYVWTDVAGQLVNKGFDVRAILLPGHGSTPKAQLKMSYTRWIRAARKQLAIYQYEAKGSSVYLGGFSMGGVIATALANENEGIAGLLLFSPAYQSTQDHLLRWSSLYSIFKPWVFGGMIREDNPTKYNSIPINGAAQYYKTAKFLKRRMRRRQLDTPTLIVASRNDSVVDIDYLLTFYKQRLSSDKKQFILYSNDSEADVESFVDVRKSEYIDQRILSQSHQGVIMSSSNPLYGEDGRVLVCNGNDWPTFSSCLFYQGVHWYAAQHAPSPDGVPVARSTYNPDFENIFKAFDDVFLSE